MRMFQDKAFLRHWTSYAAILGACTVIAAVAFFVRPHDCKSTYGPPPYYYNTDLVLWVSLADQPIAGLNESILANRPVFAYMGWLFAQPLKLVVGDRQISSDTRSNVVTSVQLATIGGLFVANFFCYLASSILLYHFSERISLDKRVALFCTFLWITSYFAFAWSYHPVNQMGGLVLIFGFPLFLLSLDRNESVIRSLFYCFVFGLLLLMKAYYVLPFIYVVYGYYKKVDAWVLILGFILFFVPTYLWRYVYE